MIPTSVPFERFAQLFEVAKRAIPTDPNAVQLATVDARGRPSLRTVLMKDFDERGWVFYSNKNSRKGRELAAQPFAALNFYWPELAAQVRIEGTIQDVPEAEADAYFASRPRESQLGAWASRQSEILTDRSLLEARLLEATTKFEGLPVARPPHWGGWRLHPDRVEFWKAHPHRLHWREVYTRNPDGGWALTLLNP